MRGPGSIPTGGNNLPLDFLFSRSEVSDGNIGIVANFGSFKKPLMVTSDLNYMVSDANRYTGL